MANLDFWFDFASTYSYPAAMRIEEWASAKNISIRWRPILLGPIFADQGWRDSPFNIYPAKGRYMWRDLERLCSKEGLPFARPDPFPQNSLLPARVAATLETPMRARFCKTVFAEQFGQGRSIDGENFLAGVLREIGAPVDCLARASSAEIKATLKASVEEARAKGVFGAPSFTTSDGELFWGFDRLHAALDWAGAAT
ncbi:MAG: 2-hydroxychromene-2-carboxylate isomerase [Rhodoblastus sp.]